MPQHMHTTVGLVNAEAKAFIPALLLGPLSFTGVGCDMKKGTADDGVCLWFKFAIPLKYTACTTCACTNTSTHV